MSVDWSCQRSGDIASFSFKYSSRIITQFRPAVLLLADVIILLYLLSLGTLEKERLEHFIGMVYLTQAVYITRLFIDII
jgi:hypothetical protein